MKAFYEQPNGMQERLPKEDNSIVMGNMNAKVSSDNMLFEYVLVFGTVTIMVRGFQLYSNTKPAIKSVG